jgi:hypothetical protein
MWYIAGACLVLALTAAAGFSRGKAVSTVKAGVVDSILNSASFKILSMQQVNWLLARLESQPAPDVVEGAMCYSAIAAPAVAEYICPVCGEKTIYDYSQSAFIDWELQSFRRFVESIDSNTEFQVTLDERLFCEFCAPEDSSGNPGLVLVVKPEEGEDVVNRVTELDLQMLDSFLQGNLYYTTFNDGQMPLLEYAGRMRELLGLTEE